MKYRNEHGVGIEDRPCGCGTVYSKGTATHYVCRGHGGGRWTEKTTIDEKELPLYDEARKAATESR